MKYPLIAANIIMYTFLLVIIIIYIALPQGNSQAIVTCTSSLSSIGGDATTVAKVYKSVVAAIALLLSVGFIVYGAALLKVMNIWSSDGKGKEKILRFTAVTFLCTVGLLMQVAILLYTTFADSVNTMAAIIVYMIAELIPTLSLIVTMRSPSEVKLKYFTGIFNDTKSTRVSTTKLSTKTDDSKIDTRDNDL